MIDKIMYKHQTRQSGAVSLFIVIFTALLVSVVTVSFIRIMVRDQQQATAVDLSQSAYDSAQAGVEDAKRALSRYETLCASDPTSSACTTALNNINSQDCNKSLEGIVDTSGDEVKIEKTEEGEAVLDQAYTCVKIMLKTNDYKGTLEKDGIKIIHLKGESDFTSIKLDWFSVKDLQGSTNTVNVPDWTNGTPLLANTSWISTTTPNQPSIMRAQLIQFGSGGFVLSDFDGSSNTPVMSDTNTLFLYPSSFTSPNTSFADNTRKSPSAPTLVHCDAALGSGGYACSTTITLPSPIGSGTRDAYLNLSSLYRQSNYRITLLSAGSVVKFDAVQPQVDSTGRANDLFRRVESRIETVGGTYPGAAVTVTGNLCKTFSVTDIVSGYTAGSCTP